MEAHLVTGSQTGSNPLEEVSTPGGRADRPAEPAPTDALADLFERHADDLVRALRAAGYPDASDAVQEAFVQAVVHWRRVCRYEEPLSWVRRVAVNKARNQARSRRRQAALAERLGRHPAPGARTPDARDDDIVAAVSALPAQQRLAAALFYYCDLSVAQTAAAMGVSEGTVKSHLHAGRAAVAQALEVTP